MSLPRATLVLLLAALAACGGSKVQAPGGGGSGGSAGHGGAGGGAGTGGSGGAAGAGGEGGTGGEGGSGGSSPSIVQDRLGDLPGGRVRAVLSFGDVTLLGVEPTPFTDADFPGWPEPANDHGYHVVGGILDLDARGHVSRLGVADGLPQASFTVGGQDAGTGPAPVTSLAWTSLGTNFVAAAGDRVVVGVIDALGVHLTSLPLRADGASADARINVVLAAGGQVYAGTDQGLALLSGTPLALQSFVALGTTGSDVRALASGTFEQGTVVVALVAAAGAPDPSELSILEPRKDPSARLLPPGDVPLSLAGTTGMVLVGTKEASGAPAVHAFAQTLTSVELETEVVPPARLVSSSGAPLVPRFLAYDETHKVLVVGGDGVAGGAVISMAFSSDQTSASPPEDLFHPIDPYRYLVPESIDLLALDTRSRIWLGGSSPCTGGGVRESALLRAEGTAAAVRRLVRPLTSGIRTVSRPALPDGTWLGLRDEAEAVACRGLPVDQQACQVKADGSCEILTPLASYLQKIEVRPGVTRIAFAPSGQQELALATIGDPPFVQVTPWAGSVDVSPLGLSTTLTAAAWGETPGQLWLGSEASWVDPTDGSGPEAFNAARPHGVAAMDVDDKGKVTLVNRFVRVAVNATDVGGLPSSTALDLLSLPGARHVLAALGREREPRAFDHVLPTARSGAGGIVELDGVTVRSYAPPSGRSFGDVVALTRSVDGKVWALDDTLGLLAVDTTAGSTSLALAAPWGASDRGTALAIDGSGNVALASTTGIWIQGSQGVTQVVAGEAGWVNALAFDPSGLLLAGTARGLVRVGYDGVQLPAQAGPSAAASRTIWEIHECPGIDNCLCVTDANCDGSMGFLCDCEAGAGCSCKKPLDPCAVDHGGVECACQPGVASCDAGLDCVCDPLHCTCRQHIMDCGGAAGCGCGGDMDCNDGLVCYQTRCFPPKCDDDCSCPTRSGCTPLLSCVNDPSPHCALTCTSDCSCASTSDGCPIGSMCVQGGCH